MSDGATEMMQDEKLQTYMAMQEMAEDFATADHEIRLTSDSVNTVFDVKEPVSGGPETALSQQVGGNHYKDFFIQPTEFIHLNNIGFIEGCVIKRICRWRNKDGLQDLKKAIHEIEMLIELEGLE